MKLDFSGVRILVLGDPMWDVYRHGHVDRMSPEAPVPVFIEDVAGQRLGGAANVANQLSALKCEVGKGWGPQIVGSPEWTRKTRYMVGSHQLLRVDEDRCVPNTIPSLNGFHAIVISDYAKGACTPEICQEAIASGLPVIVDPKGTDWTKYAGAKVLCPNEKEWEAVDCEQPDGTIVVAKHGDKGLALVTKREDGTQEAELFPIHAKRVYDVTGAGDTVVAVITACVAKGIDLSTACKLSNAAAGYVVGEVGTTVCPLEYIQEYSSQI